MLSRITNSAIVGLTLLLGGLALPMKAIAHSSEENAQRLPVMGPAPEFTLTDIDGRQLSLADLKGNVVLVTFIYASCLDVCPLLTDKLVGVQQRLGAAFGTKVRFVPITVDPDVDRPAALRDYGERMGAVGNGWSFLTGGTGEIRDVAGRYGVLIRKRANGDVDHNLLTSLIDGSGFMRVQYMGQRFDPNELLHDLQDLIKESNNN